MKNNQPVEIIKGALLLERKGKSFYQTVASQTKSETVKQIFSMMAAEEEQHVRILTQQYVKLVHEGKLAEMHYDAQPTDVASEVLNQKIRTEINAAGYEAAAISAAIGMEDKAIEYYSSQAEKATSPIEKELFQWLANWEKTHLKLLIDLDNNLREDVWYDNNFWPE